MLAHTSRGSWPRYVVRHTGSYLGYKKDGRYNVPVATFMQEMIFYSYFMVLAN